MPEEGLMSIPDEARRTYALGKWKEPSSIWLGAIFGGINEVKREWERNLASNWSICLHCEIRRTKEDHIWRNLPNFPKWKRFRIHFQCVLRSRWICVRQKRHSILQDRLRIHELVYIVFTHLPHLSIPNLEPNGKRFRIPKLAKPIYRWAKIDVESPQKTELVERVLICAEMSLEIKNRCLPKRITEANLISLD